MQPRNEGVALLFSHPIGSTVPADANAALTLADRLALCCKIRVEHFRKRFAAHSHTPTHAVHEPNARTKKVEQRDIEVGPPFASTASATRLSYVWSRIQQHHFHATHSDSRFLQQHIVVWRVAAHVFSSIQASLVRFSFPFVERHDMPDSGVNR